MQFAITAAAFLALISSAIAQVDGFDAITAPTKGQAVTADGKTATTITWEPSSEYDGQKVSILLLQGASDATLDYYTGDDVACEFHPPLLSVPLSLPVPWMKKETASRSIGNHCADQDTQNIASIDSALGSYSWTPDSSIAGYATYGLKLQLDSDPTVFQYSFPFKIAAGSDDASSSSASKTTTSSVVTTTSAPSNNKVAQTSSDDSSVASTSTTTSAAASVTSVSTTGNSSDAGSSAATTAAQTTLSTATAATATGSSATSSTTTVVTAGAAKVAVGGFAAVGGVMAMLLV